MSFPEPGLALRFLVTIDSENMGFWTKCEGLSVEWEVFEYKEGGLNDFVHRLPGRTKYSTIKLTRTLNPLSAQVAAWISKAKGPAAGHTAEIRVLDTEGSTVVSWSVADVFPVRWSGPTLDVNGREVANETLELAHNGFTAA
jgi:phage tail-like protein